MKKLKCHAQKCNKEATRIIRKRVGLSVYCEEHYQIIMERRKKMQDKLFCEMDYKERLKINFKENSMLYKFYLWLYKNKRRKQ